LPANRAALEFGGTERFVLEGRLGEGGMGVVYRARDRESSVPVALKTMAYVEPSALLRFKNEFRSLSDISHPNLVQLYEMVSEGEHWFFTMELLEGVDFLRWVHHGELLSVDMDLLLTPWQERSGTLDSAPTIDAVTLPEATASTSGVLDTKRDGASRLCDIERLRPALRQLAQGVLAIHAAGKLHRDIKPSNVMVTPEGRVVLLDFGVVGDLASVQDNPRLEDQILGTPAYMAPEQARGVPAGMSADWYSVGVMMYEALTDHLPFDGSPQDILFSKQGNRASRPSELVEGVPEDLDALCMDLLSPDPRKRPRGEDVLRRLTRAEESGRTAPHAALSTGSLRPFVGRKQQIAVLDSAFQASKRGQPVVVLMAGRSGMGKTVLSQRFLSRLAKDQGALVLSGRCFEREALPFKGMDSVVDELSRYLTAQAPREIAEALPPGLHYLTRVFPVLRAVPCFSHLPAPEHEVVEPIELRKRAFAALKELLGALAALRPLVVHIDDVQWSDIDSLVLLEGLLQPPNAPPVLLLCGFREEVRLTSPVLHELSSMLQRLGQRVSVQELSVDQLSAEEAVELAQLSLDGGQGAPSELARAIALESQGVPIFVSELAEWQLERAARSDGELDASPRGVSLEQVIRNRVAELPCEASALLEVLSVANGPVPYALAERAGGVERSDALRARLRAARLVRTFRADGQEFVEAYHARVRDSVVATLPAERRRSWHGALARALEASGTADPEALVEHYLGAGDSEHARLHVLTAALAAESGLAFLRASRLYRMAIEIGVERPRHDLLSHVGDALVNAGRSSEAADAYQEAAEVAPSAQAIELRRRAAEHYLKSGRDLDGLTVLRTVLHSVGLRYPQSPGGAVTSLVYHRARLRLRGLSFKSTAAEQCDARDLTRVDVAFSATAGLAMVDVLRGADFGAQQLQLALDAGEPIRICRALAFEAGNAAAVGAGSRDRIERLVRTAEGLSLRSQDPHGTALAKIAGGLVRVFSGEWRSAQRMLDEAEVLLRERCRAVTWELTNTQAWSCNSLILCGDLREAAARMPTLLGEASERSDRYALMHMIYPACITALAADDVATGWRVATDDSTFRSCEPGRFTAGHWGRLISTQSVHRYRGEGKQARAFVQREWPGLSSSQFLRVHLMRVFSEFERALSIISALDEGETAASVAREGERSVKRVLRDSPEYAAPMGHFVAGCLAAVRGDRERALTAFERAAPGLEAADMGYLSLCARQRYAELLGGDSGRELVRKCREDFGKRGVVDVGACLTMSAPGFRKIGTSL
jgi:eukaryotic-like serine/threonine-protein kinase